MTSMPTASPQDPTPELDFTQEVYELVRDTAPRLFAVVEEYRPGTDDADAVVVAWGLAYESGEAEVIHVSGVRRWRLPSAEGVMRHFRRAEDRTPRLVWLAPPCSDAGAREECAV